MGDTTEPFALASVTKLLTAMTVLIAHEEHPRSRRADRPGDSTTTDLLAHSAGVAPDTLDQLAPPRTCRSYIDLAYDLAADAVAERSGIAFQDYLDEAPSSRSACTPPTSADPPVPGHGPPSTILSADRRLAPARLIGETTLSRPSRPISPISTALPGFGTQRPNPWGIGPGDSGPQGSPLTAASNSPHTYGHFGQAGTMLWIDPMPAPPAVALCTEPFGSLGGRGVAPVQRRRLASAT